MLAVGDLDGWGRRRERPPADARVAYVDFGQLSDELLDALTPWLVVSPALARCFDCVDLAQKLDEVGFRGRYRVLADNVPRPDVVLHELRTLYPNLDIEVDETAAQQA